MILPILCLTPVSFVIAWVVTRMMRTLAPQWGFVDRPGGRKIHDNPMPLGGGIGIFTGVFLPLIFLLIWVMLGDAPLSLASRLGISQTTLAAYWSGAREQVSMGLCVFAAAGMLLVLGLCDDMVALGPMRKLILQFLIVAALVFCGNLRILTVLGYIPSMTVTIVWIVAITNAFNFLDNMDGLSAGVAAVCAVTFLAATLSIGQWFVAAALALMLGSLLGFLWHNFPPARIFMGDAGSMVIGLLLGVLTVRTTYLPEGASWQNRWYAVFAPVIVLALPLYDLVVVVFVRLLSGRSPFVGDTNHFSHRLVNRGMSRRSAVLCLYLVAAATSVAASILPHVSGNMAILIFVQTLLILGVVAILESR